MGLMNPGVGVLANCCCCCRDIIGCLDAILTEAGGVLLTESGDCLIWEP